MTQLLSQVSQSIARLVAGAAPILTAIRIGPNQHVTGSLWRNDLIVTCDQALPVAASYTIVLATGALISAQPGPRDPVNNLASLRLDVPIPLTAPDTAHDAATGALVLAMGAHFDGSPTVRLTAIHRIPHSPGTGSGSAITLDLPAERVSHGGIVLDAEGRLLGMTSASPGGDAIVMPHGVIARFVEAASASFSPAPVTAASMPLTATSMAAQPIQRATATNVDETAGRTVEAPRTGQGETSDTSGSHRRGWLGVALQPITVPDALAHRAGQRTARQVVGITRGGPADRAGLRSGDVLLALDGSSTSGNHALRAFLAPERIGSEVEVRLMRDGLIHTTTLTIAAPPAQR